MIGQSDTNYQHTVLWAARSINPSSGRDTGNAMKSLETISLQALVSDEHVLTVQHMDLSRHTDTEEDRGK